MLTVLRDYLAINRAGLARVYATTYLLLLFVLVGVLLQRGSDWDLPLFLAVSLLSAIMLAGGLGVFLLPWMLLEACGRGWKLAREVGVPIGEYARTDDYRRRRQGALKRPDKKIKWV